MKKISILLLTTIMAITLTGCRNNISTTDAITSKICTIKQNGIEQTYKYTATNDEIDKVELTMVYDNSLFGVETLSTLTESQKEQITTEMLNSLELESTTYEGLDINIDIQDQMKVNLKADLTKANPEILKKVGLDFTDADMNLERTVEDMTDAGAVCK